MTYCLIQLPTGKPCATNLQFVRRTYRQVAIFRHEIIVNSSKKSVKNEGATVLKVNSLLTNSVEQNDS
jgi:hypothetical protein